MRRMWPFRQVGLKLLSLGVAVLLWMTVSGEETVERVLRVPLELQQFPVGLEIQGEAPSTVDVRVKGTSGGLSRVGAGDVVAVLDLRGARAGSRLFPLTPEQVRERHKAAIARTFKKRGIDPQTLQPWPKVERMFKKLAQAGMPVPAESWTRSC